MQKPDAAYKQRIESLTLSLTQLQRRKSLFGWLRFFTMLSVIAAVWMAITNSQLLLLPLIVALVAIFFRLLYKDANNNEAIENHQRLLAVNETELQILHHHFTHLPNGIEYLPPHHAYANDLDVFGNASLYQYINRTQSQQGNNLMAHSLLHAADNETINRRHEAIKELRSELEWRQQLQSYGMATPITTATEQKIKKWLQEPSSFSHNKYWRVLRYIFPAISFGILGLHIAGIISANNFYTLIILCLVGASLISRLVMPAYNQLEKIAPQLAALSACVKWIEESGFKSSLLTQLINNYKQPVLASARIKSLQNILERLDIRLNPVVFIPLNTFLFWDLQQVLALEKWKEDNRQNIDTWFSTLAETEVLATLGTLHFNHPHWCFPQLSSDQSFLLAEEMGHPLIPAEKIVHNSITVKEGQQLCLITGSNMAGKSTFLRSTGVNVVLAMMGAPVYAKSFTLSPMQVVSSMRITDNLEESTSTFYAELKKLKEVIDAVNNKQKVFLLLDEILRGTNSADRHTGSKALIKQLVQNKAVGMLATHDIALASLANEYPTDIHNYHFDVQVSGEELYFDYKLKEGICQSMNATILMKKIGIEL